MTVTCPSGHSSATSDYCDQCGAPIARGRDAACSRRSSCRSSRTPIPRRRSVREPLPSVRRRRVRGTTATARAAATTFSLRRPGMTALGGGGQCRPVAVRAPANRRASHFLATIANDAVRARRAADADRPPPRRARRARARDRPRGRARGSRDLPAARRSRTPPGRRLRDPRPGLDEWHDGQRRLGAARPRPPWCRSRTATASGLAPGRRSSSAAAERAQKSCGASSPALSTIVASRSALLVLGQLIEVEAREQSPEMALDRVDAQRDLVGDRRVGRRRSRLPIRRSGGRGRSAPCAGSRRTESPPATPTGRAVDWLSVAALGSRYTTRRLAEAHRSRDRPGDGARGSGCR